VSAIEAVVARFARSRRHDFWPRFTAREAGVSTTDARDAMITLAEDGLLDLWYVVICENGDEISRAKHPKPAPVGERVTCYRCDEPDTFDVTDDDVYLMFSPTDRLLRLAGQVVEEEPASPKGVGADSAASAPFPVELAELARLAPGWNDDARKIEFHLHQHNYYGDTVGGDKVGADKVGGDRVGRDKAGRDTSGGVEPEREERV
jgi:hypothetical protein